MSTWKNEVIGAHLGKSDLQYDIVHQDGTIENATIHLKNPIVTKGTRHNAENMNNHFDFDNVDCLRDYEKEVSFPSQGKIEERIVHKTSRKILGKIVTDCTKTGTIARETWLYGEDEGDVLRKTTVKTTFVNGKIKEVIES